MKLIATGSKVIEFLINDESIISGKLSKISIYYKDNRLIIELNINLLYSKQYSEVIIQLLDVMEYSLFYSSKSNFYFIENYKFFYEDGAVYISLDPSETDTSSMDIDDNDYVKAKDVTLFAPNCNLAHSDL
jgi:hypothetical protein